MKAMKSHTECPRIRSAAREACLDRNMRTWRPCHGRVLAWDVVEGWRGSCEGPMLS